MPIIYLNNTFLDENDAKINIRDRGFLLGDGVFETIKVILDHPLFLKEHIERLNKSCETIHIKINLDLNEIENIIKTLITKNNLIEKTSVVRITITRGSSSRGLIPDLSAKPTVLITSEQYYENKKEVFSVFLSSIKKNEYSNLSQIKSLNYLENILAKIEAQKNNADEAILLNTKGNISSGSCSNIFIVLNNQIITPPISDGALPGIIRNKLIETAKDLSMQCIESSITVKDLEKADEIFLTNSLIGIQPVSVIKNINHHKLKKHVVNKINSLAQGVGYY